MHRLEHEAAASHATVGAAHARATHADDTAAAVGDYEATGSALATRADTAAAGCPAGHDGSAGRGRATDEDAGRAVDYGSCVDLAADCERGAGLWTRARASTGVMRAQRTTRTAARGCPSTALLLKTTTTTKPAERGPSCFPSALLAVIGECGNFWVPRKNWLPLRRILFIIGCELVGKTRTL